MNTYNLEFQSQSFRLLTDHNEEDFQNLKSEVENKLNEIKKAHTNLSTEKALLLTCLSLAEDKLFLQKAVGKNIDQLESQAKSILKEIERTPGSELEILP